MNFRSRFSTAPFSSAAAAVVFVRKKNDGLPIVNGIKVQRRNNSYNSNNNGDGRDDGPNNNTIFSNNKYYKGHNNNNNNRCSSSNNNNILNRWIAVLTMILMTMIGIIEYNSNAAATFGIVSSSSSSSSQAAAAAAAAAAVSTNKTPAIIATSPDQCTKEQLDATLKQLPDSIYCRRPWARYCSFRAKTSGCQNPILARAFYASKSFKVSGDRDQPFIGVVLGWDGNDVPIDMLHVGSTLNPKYNLGKKWNELLGGKDDSCRTPITSTSNDAAAAAAAANAAAAPYRNAHMYVVNWDNSVLSKPAMDLIQLKNQPPNYIINDNEMIVHKINTYDYIGKKDSLTKLFHDRNNKFFDWDDSTSTISDITKQPIHYLDMQRGEGLDYTILTELIPTLLNQVRFLKFEYNKQGSWLHQSLKELIYKLKNDNDSGLICYWSGSDTSTDNALWRITDCFLDHYEHQQYARIQCVSSKHDDVKELAIQMENKFLQTIQKNIIGGNFTSTQPP